MDCTTRDDFECDPPDIGHPHQGIEGGLGVLAPRTGRQEVRGGPLHEDEGQGAGSGQPVQTPYPAVLVARQAVLDGFTGTALPFDEPVLLETGDGVVARVHLSDFCKDPESLSTFRICWVLDHEMLWE